MKMKILIKQHNEMWKAFQKQQKEMTNVGIGDDGDIRFCSTLTYPGNVCPKAFKFEVKDTQSIGYDFDAPFVKLEVKDNKPKFKVGDCRNCGRKPNTSCNLAGTCIKYCNWPPPVEKECKDCVDYQKAIGREPCRSCNDKCNFRLAKKELAIGEPAIFWNTNRSKAIVAKFSSYNLNSMLYHTNEDGQYLNAIPFESVVQYKQFIKG